ncbi:MAG: DUF6098 family protein [Labedaea sp.]
MDTLERLDELVGLLDLGIPLYLRYSPGPEADAAHPSVDHESGLAMPGHSANPLQPPDWWTLPVADWLARRVCQYLREMHEGARPWVLTGAVVDFGPDNEPLLVNLEPIAWLSPGLVDEAHRHYRERLDAGRSRR